LPACRPLSPIGSAATAGFQQANECGRVGRLGEVDVETGCQGSATILRAAIARLRDQENLVRQFAAQLPGNVVPVHARQAEVDDGDVRPPGQSLFDAFDTVGGNSDFVAYELEKQPQGLSTVPVVLNHKHTERNAINTKGILIHRWLAHTNL
jgi:hypothetical protein